MISDFVDTCVRAYTPITLATLKHVLLLVGSMILVCQLLRDSYLLSTRSDTEVISLSLVGSVAVLAASHALKYFRRIRRGRGS